MNVVTTVKEVRDHYRVTVLRNPGFVPTMGALHEGHLSLVRQAVKENRMVGVSIFVNPTQFNDPDDLTRYPRTLDADLELLSPLLRTSDFVFVPSPEEIYPEPDTRQFDLGTLDKVMEGLHRPGHFNGVVQVVSRLFDIIRPSSAYFGEKDLQQLTIIRELARRDYPDVRIVACPIIREHDGLAMSSRNRRLLTQHRALAGEVYRTLIAASAMINDYQISEIRDFVFDRINMIPGFTIEYFEIVDGESLTPVTSQFEMKPGASYFGCIALWVGEVRLIDNIGITLR